MTANAVFAAVAAGGFGLLCVVTWHLVLMLKQVRQTAFALEQFLVTARPRVEAATENLGSLLGRTDRFMAKIEEGRGPGSGAFGLIGQAMSGWLTGTQAVSTISAGIAAIMQAWSKLSQTRTAPRAEAAMGGEAHE